MKYICNIWDPCFDFITDSNFDDLIQWAQDKGLAKNYEEAREIAEKIINSKKNEAHEEWKSLHEKYDFYDHNEIIRLYNQIKEENPELSPKVILSIIFDEKDRDLYFETEIPTKIEVDYPVSEHTREGGKVKVKKHTRGERKHEEMMIYGELLQENKESFTDEFQKTVSEIIEMIRAGDTQAEELIYDKLLMGDKEYFTDEFQLKVKEVIAKIVEVNDKNTTTN